MKRILSTIVLVAALVLAVAPRASAAPNPPRLPSDFLWGVSTSAFQSEGYSAPSNWTRYSAGPDVKDEIGNSVDFRHRYKSDIALAQGLGVKVYRFGIDWARIEPRPGRFDRNELAYYDDVVKTIRAAGMRPMITLDHWVYPAWVADRGGWANPQITDWWLRYNRMIVDRYASDDPLWITFNEPTMYMALEAKFGGIRPDRLPQMADRIVLAHNWIYRYIHQRQRGAMVSSNIAYIPGVQPAFDAALLDRISGSLDYVGLDYYYSMTPTDVPWLTSLVSPWAAPISADGIYYALRDLSRRFPGKPLYVVESGQATENGKPRPDGYDRANHLRDLVYWVQRAEADGIDVIGYNYWSLTDNYEWGSYTPRFGLYTVDVKNDPTLTRKPTDAVAAYRQITANNGVPANYRPTRPAVACSLVAGLESCLEPVR